MFLDGKGPRIERPLHPESIEDSCRNNFGPKTTNGVDYQLNDNGWKVDLWAPVKVLLLVSYICLHIMEAVEGGE